AELAEQRALFEPLRQDGRPIVAVVAASGNARKDWTPEGYAAVVDALEHELGCRTLLVGGPGEREVSLARGIQERARAKPLWALGDGVRRVLWLIHGSDLLISPDTGPLHMARAMDVPVIGLFGHTNPWRVGPYRKYEDLWVDHYNEPGDPADASRAEPKLGRMETITPREVLERVQRAIDAYGVGQGQGQGRRQTAGTGVGAAAPCAEPGNG
ncbi:MAG TPA: glycosyltransferase family 9 protein, partial [Longimicrobiales bacterium]